MDNNFAEQFEHSVHQQAATQQKQRKTLFKFIIITVAAIILLTSIVVSIIIINNVSKNDPGVDEFGDITEIKETLNSEFETAANAGPHANYETDRKDSAYSNFTPEQICRRLGLKCSDLASPTKLEIFKQVETLNSNALDYYIDNAYIIVMTAVYADSVSTTPYPFVIYARTGGLYYVFDPNSEYSVYMTMEELFNEITGVPSFYVTKGRDGD